MKNKRIWLSPPHMSGKEREYVNEAFDTNWISPAGPNIDEFEKQIERYLGEGVHAAALSSGTAAIHLALILTGVKYGDEVICSTFTFSGSCNPILYLGARPVFVDSEEETWNMSPEFLREAILDRINVTGKAPKAIIIVDLYGMPAKFDELLGIAAEFDIPVIEDSAEALGSSYMGQKCGTFGDFGILSFNGNKIITTSGGGALISKNPKHIEKAKFLATQARDQAPHYQHSEIGYNYRLSNVSAGIGRGQIEVIDERVQRRKEIFKFYQENLSDLLDFLNELDGLNSNRWLTTGVLKNSKQNPAILRKNLEDSNIESRLLWKPMHLQPIFKKYPYYGSGFSNHLFECGICLPSGSSLNQEELNLIVKTLKK